MVNLWKLLHADISVIDAYFSQFSRILNVNGSAFIHHWNLGEYHHILDEVRKIEERLHWRDPSVDAEKVESIAQEYGLSCVSQEMVLWGTNKTFIDCFTTIVKKNSLKEISNKVLRNEKFMAEARNLLQLSKLYTPANIA